MFTEPQEHSAAVPRLLSATQRAVAELWCEALEISDLPLATDNFFSLGGDSITMTLVEFRVREELSVDLQPGALLSAQTLEEFAALVEKHGKQRG
jgi:acyl carrier protein